MVLITSLDKVIWNWMDHYPNEFAELQKNPNEELSKNCEVLFDILDGFADNKKSRAAIWPLQIVLLLFSRVSKTFQSSKFALLKIYCAILCCRKY